LRPPTAARANGRGRPWTLRAADPPGSSDSAAARELSRPGIKHPQEAIRIAPLRLALDHKISPPTVNWSPGCGLATSLARTSKVAVSARMRVSPKLRIVSGRRAIIRIDPGSPPAGA
jgi:hypothetical protein